MATSAPLQIDGREVDRSRLADLYVRFGVAELASETGEHDGDRVFAELDAWFVGDALRTADRSGLL